MEKPNPKRGRGTNAVLRFLNARVSLPSWMLALSSAALGYIALFLLLNGTGLGTFGEGLLFSAIVWVILEIIGSTATIVGLMVRKATLFLRWGAFLSFLMWIFGGVSFAVTGQAITAAVVVAPWLIFYAYVYLASFFRDATGI